MTQLPDKPSELIRLALKDLALVEKDDRYKVDMNVYHCLMSWTGKCAVCFAGSIQAKSLNASVFIDTRPSTFDIDTREKLYALDRFRLGFISYGLRFMDIPFDKHIRVPVTPYETSPAKFKRDMIKIAKTFEGLGL